MNKEFDSWNRAKKSIHYFNQQAFYHEREIWWCSFGVNVGFEQDGTGKNFDRPALILKGFSPDVCLVLPLTGSRREGVFYFPLGAVSGREASVILSQIRLIDTKRFIRKITTIDTETFEHVKISLQKLIFGTKK